MVTTTTCRAASSSPAPTGTPHCVWRCERSLTPRSRMATRMEIWSCLPSFPLKPSIIRWLSRRCRCVYKRSILNWYWLTIDDDDDDKYDNPSLRALSTISHTCSYYHKFSLIVLTVHWLLLFYSIPLDSGCWFRCRRTLPVYKRPSYHHCGWPVSVIMLLQMSKRICFTSLPKIKKLS